VIRRAIIDKNVRIGKGVKLLNRNGIENTDSPDACYYIREGIIIVPKGATILDGIEV
jgi:glucose-1-phosphate adenylyltransferase